MSRNQDDLGHLSNRDKELVALGAAIASNCIPCVEYHIPQARKAGLNDLEIGDAVALADKVRRVPAHKVLQTASALLEGQHGTRIKSESEACTCSDTQKNSADGTSTGPDDPDAHNVRLDNKSSVKDNEKKKGRYGDDAKDSTHERGPEEAAAGSQDTADHAGFDFSKMMEMMQKCCPDKMKDFSSMMSDFEKGCCSPSGNASSD